MLPSSLASAPPSPTLLRARGALDVFAATDGAVVAAGWIGHPDCAIESATVFVDDHEIGTCALSRREDLVGLWPHLPAIHVSGYHVRGALPPSRNGSRAITVVGSAQGGSRTLFRTQRPTTQDEVVTPHPKLLQRVTNNRDPAAYVQIGLDAAMDLRCAIAAHRELTEVRQILDWGCGPGRVFVPLQRLVPHAEITGCDLDAEAIAWCNRHVRAGAFHVNEPSPPLPFPAETFDAIIAVSVMTHLDWPVQRAWLREIRRLLRPGGLFAASVHGPFAAAFFPARREQLLRRGFVADEPDRGLNGIAPHGYYRAAFQTPEFTRSNWGRELTILEHREAGLAGFQDLVVAQRPRHS